MFLDNLLTFDTGSAITATATSVNTLDMSQARDMGIGDDKALKLLVDIGTAFTTSNGGTLNVQFQGSTDSVTWSTYAESGVLAVGVLTAGSRPLQIDLPRPPAGLPTPRYYRLNYTVGTGVFTAGTIGYAGLVLDRDDYVGYPSGFTATN